MGNVTSIYHYTYQITHIPSSKLYIGVRSSKVPPEEDLGIIYFSSSHDKDFKLEQKTNPDHYCYEVLGVYPTREEAGEEEIRLHKLHDVGRNPDFYNRSRQTSTGWDATGMMTVRDKDGNTFRVIVDDPRFLSGELVHINKGMLTVRDKGGNAFSVPVDDPLIASGELVSHTKGMKWYKNESLNESKMFKPNDVIPEGWVPGLLRNPDMKWYKNVSLKKSKMFMPGDVIPEGWVPGRINNKDLSTTI